jgi:hypothetical protein
MLSGKDGAASDVPCIKSLGTLSGSGVLRRLVLPLTWNLLNLVLANMSLERVDSVDAAEVYDYIICG